jgi:hypothetical protein
VLPVLGVNCSYGSPAGSDTCHDGRGFKVSLFLAAAVFVIVEFDGLTYETKSLQIG